MDAAPKAYSTIQGRVETAYPGDWILSYDNGVIVAVCGPQEYARTYEPLVEVPELTLTPADLTALAPCLRFGATNSARDLVQAVQSLAVVQIGEVTVPFTPGQIAELKLRADKRHMPYDAYVRLIVQHILDNFFLTKA